MKLLTIKRHVDGSKTAGTEYKGIIYIYSEKYNKINVITKKDVKSFEVKYFNNPEWYIQ